MTKIIYKVEEKYSTQYFRIIQDAEDYVVVKKLDTKPKEYNLKDT